MKNVAVIGAGVMGCDVALHLACYAHNVTLKDINKNVLNSAKDRIVEGFSMVKMMNPIMKQIQIDDFIERITFASNYNEFDKQHYVIENVTEDWVIKSNLYRELNEVCNDAVKFFVNTSCISITKIASVVKNPQNVIGMHFMNPVPLKELVEMVKGYHTSTETISTATEFLSSVKKKPVIVNDYPGFVANRLSHLFMNEASFLIQDQVATPKEVDLIFTKGYGHAMGPLSTADLIGLDTVVQSLNILYQSYQDTKFRCCPLLIKMVDAGLLGKKSGQGFYKY